MNVSLVGASTVGTLAAADLAGDVWSGLPSSAGVLGTAAGALGLGALMARRGPRAGMGLGYALAAIGGLTATGGVVAERMLLLIAGLALIGVGNGGAQLARYAAADLYPPERRGFVLGIVVWGGTIGAVIGPAVIAPAASVAGSVGLPDFAGAYLLAMFATVVATLISIGLPRERRSMVRTGGRGRFLAALRIPTVRIALVAMVTAQLAMVGVMTMTPLHLDDLGHGLDTVGWVLTVHIIGMFALSPLSGRLADRIGGVTTIVCGVGTLLISAAVTFTASTHHTFGLPLGLFLLGYGWNLAFVGGSALLSRDLPAEHRTALQGAVDAVVWSSSALAGLTAGAVFAGLGYQILTVLAGVISLSPLAVLPLVRRGALPEHVAGDTDAQN